MLTGFCGSITCVEDCKSCGLYEPWEIEDMIEEMKGGENENS